MEKLLKGKGRGIFRRGILQERGDAVSLGILSCWDVANVTTVTLNYIFVMVVLFPLNVGVSPCLYYTVLVPVQRLYTSCFHNTVVSSCYRLHTSVCMMQVLLRLTCGQSIMMFLDDGTQCQLHHEGSYIRCQHEGSCIQCQQLC